MTYEQITLEKEESIAIITLNRPEKLNALGSKMLDELTLVLEELAGDRQVKVMILTGAGRGFCAGIDLTEPASAANIAERRFRLQPFGRYGTSLLKIKSLAIPTIAAVNGIAAGGGFSLALCCDIRLASEKAAFSASFVKRGLVPDGGITYLLPQSVGTAHALELLLTGDTIDAQEASRLGLVSKVIPAEELLNEAKKLAGRIDQGAPIAIELARKSVYKAMENKEFSDVMAYEAWAQSICAKSEDSHEGIRAFLERRAPLFEGK